MKTRTTGLVLLAVLSLVSAACADDEATETTSAPATTTAETTPPATEPPAEEPPLSPSALEAADQSSDGTSMVVASVTLPSPGFIAVHADADGGPGAVIGHSELLPVGVSQNVTVVFDEALTESATVWPMVHIDLDSNGEYEFEPPDNAVDLPGLLENGDVAVTPVAVTVQ